jgi:hypothetical protein
VTIFEFSEQEPGKPVYWLTRKTLQKRLSLMLPEMDMTEVVTVSTELPSNASFVNYVRHHTLTHLPSGAVLDVVEKSIRKLGFVSSLEAGFYRERWLFADSVHFQHPPCHALIETPGESLIFTQFVKGKTPHLHAIAGHVARGIAEIESVSGQHLRNSPKTQALKYWRMDFFRPWYLLRPRFNFSRLLPNLSALAAQESRFAGLEAQLRPFIAQLKKMARVARRSTRCLCHLDYLRKNLFVSEQGLHLIDWSEVKVGRIGFDGGAYLSAVFRGNSVERYKHVSEEFFSVYAQALGVGADKSIAIANARYVFLLNSLWYCMREQTIAEYRQTGKLNLLREKFEYLLTLKIA